MVTNSIIKCNAMHNNAEETVHHAQQQNIYLYVF